MIEETWPSASIPELTWPPQGMTAPGAAFGPSAEHQEAVPAPRLNGQHMLEMPPAIYQEPPRPGRNGRPAPAAPAPAAPAPATRPTTTPAGSGSHQKPVPWTSHNGRAALQPPPGGYQRPVPWPGRNSQRAPEVPPGGRQKPAPWPEPQGRPAPQVRPAGDQKPAPWPGRNGQRAPAAAGEYRKPAPRPPRNGQRALDARALEAPPARYQTLPARNEVSGARYVAPPAGYQAPAAARYEAPAAGYEAPARYQEQSAAPARKVRRKLGKGKPSVPADDALEIPQKQGRKRGRDQEHDPGLAAEGIAGNLVMTKLHVTAWYVLPLQRWSFLTPGQRETQVAAQAARLTQLTGRRCYYRITSRPFEASRWAAELDASTRGRHPVLLGPCARHPHRSEPGCPTCIPGHAWLDWLREQQVRIRTFGLADREVYFGVRLSGRTSLTRSLGQAWRRAADAELTSLTGTAERVTTIIAGAGLGGEPATAEQMQWLFHRSCGLHLPALLPSHEQPAPVPYALPGSAAATTDRSGLAQFTGGVTWTAEPFGRTVLIERGDGAAVHVAVLTIGELGPQELGGPSPWIQRADQLSFPTECAVTFDVRRPKDVAVEMRRKIDQIYHQHAHITVDHGQPAPIAMERQMDAARRIQDETETGMQAGRVHAWTRIAVAGETRKEALERVAELTELYHGVTVIHSPGQYQLAREFIPGEPLADFGHRQPIKTQILAAGMPAAAAKIGHRHGFPLGATSSLSCRAVTWHPWHGMESGNRSGLVTITGTLGSGKTTLAGLLAYMAVRAGVVTAILDPSGLLDRLCTIPEIAGSAQAVNLLASPAGTLCPYRLISDPVWQDFLVDERGQSRDADAAEKAWRAAGQAAIVARRQLTADILRMLLPANVVSENTEFALREAVQRAPADTSSSPSQVIDELHKLDDYGLGQRAPLIARSLEAITEHPLARLFFPPAGSTSRELDPVAPGNLLTVMTLQGLTLPGENRPASERTVEEQLSLPVLHLAAQLLRRHILGRDRHARKLTVLDEASQVTRDPVGRALLTQLARDSRKNNHCTILVSQNPQDLLRAEIANLTGAVFTGRTDGDQEQAASVALLGLPAGVGHEERLAKLSADGVGREFLFADGDGVEQIRVDLGGNPGLTAALNSTPTGAARAGAR